VDICLLNKWGSTNSGLIYLSSVRLVDSNITQIVIAKYQNLQRTKKTSYALQASQLDQTNVLCYVLLSSHFLCYSLKYRYNMIKI